VEILAMEVSVIPEQHAKLRCVNSIQEEIAEAPKNNKSHVGRNQPMLDTLRN
jgi:hypothetical protein